MNGPVYRDTYTLTEEVKNNNLAIACIKLTMEYLKQNRDNNLSKDSFFYGVLFIERLFIILKEIDNIDEPQRIRSFQKSIRTFINRMIHIHDRNYKNISVSKPDNKSIDVDMHHDRFYHIIDNHIKIKQENNSTSLDNDSVSVIKVTDCHEKRENLSLTEQLRVIARSLKNPVGALTEEISVILNYQIRREGCDIDEGFILTAGKIGSSIESLFSLIPIYNSFRTISLVGAIVIEMIADGIDSKELSIDKVSEVDGYLRSLTKDIVSSLSTKQVKEFSIADSSLLVKEMLKDFTFEKNKLTISTFDVKKTVLPDNYYHNFVDEDSENIIYYYEDGGWRVSEDIGFNSEVERIKGIIRNFWLKEGDISFVRNSSPKLYGNNVLAKYNGELYALVNDKLHPIQEIEITSDVYRYILYNDGFFSPLINYGSKWAEENKSSFYLSENIIDFFQRK